MSKIDEVKMAKVKVEVEIPNGAYCRDERSESVCNFFWESEDGDTGCCLLNKSTFIEGDISRVPKFIDCPIRDLRDSKTMITGLESEPDESLLLSDKEIETVVDKAFNEDCLLQHFVESRGHWEDLAPIIAKAQLAKDEAELKGIREQTLKEVGEWLDNKTHHQAKLFGIDDKYYVIVADGDIKTIQEGRMP